MWFLCTQFCRQVKPLTTVSVNGALHKDYSYVCMFPYWQNNKDMDSLIRSTSEWRLVHGGMMGIYLPTSSYIQRSILCPTWSRDVGCYSQCQVVFSVVSWPTSIHCFLPFPLLYTVIYYAYKSFKKAIHLMCNPTIPWPFTDGSQNPLFLIYVYSDNYQHMFMIFEQTSNHWLMTQDTGVPYNVIAIKPSQTSIYAILFCIFIVLNLFQGRL